MKCEMCGSELSSLLIDIFSTTGDDAFLEYPVEELDFNAVCVDVSPDWAGDELTEEEQMETIECPICRKFPFKNKEILVYHTIRLVCFKCEEEL